MGGYVRYLQHLILFTTSRKLNVKVGKSKARAPQVVPESVYLVWVPGMGIGDGRICSFFA